MIDLRVSTTALAIALLAGCGTGSGTPCNSSNCSGCCDNSGTCQTGETPAYCGHEGAKCQACNSSDSCVLGACVNSACNASNCPGCCDANNHCQTPGVGPGANATCGANGATCQACTSSQLCNADGVCMNVTNASCGPSSCGGCCIGSTCITVSNQSTSQCGTGGGSCISCSGGDTCQSGNCTSGSNDGGSCLAVGASCTTSGSTNGCCSGYCSGGVCKCNHTGGDVYQCVTNADCCVGGSSNTTCSLGTPPSSPCAAPGGSCPNSCQ